MSATRLPEGLLLAYYGDDFTGSTDVMEVMTFAGLPTVLFLDPPSERQRARFADHRGIGIAGTARSRSPAWMRANLPHTLGALHASGAPILQYKVCSTFDSSPGIGSIGTALEIGRALRPESWSPILVGAPRLGRYQAFANLFAVFEGEHHRLDRHPTMARHPATPMREADLRRHLAAQTTLPIGLIDLVAMKRGAAAKLREKLLERGIAAQLLDVIDEETLREAGRLVWENRGRGIFTVSSSGLQYALVAHWRACGMLDPPPSPRPRPPVDRLLVLSGSCAPTTAAQIRSFEAAGAVGLRLDPRRLLDETEVPGQVARQAARARRLLSQGRDVVLYTACGPEDPAIAAFDQEVARRGFDAERARACIGAALGEIAAAVLAATDLRRLVICGGDTSGHAAARLGIFALTALLPLAPGSPLCRAWSDDPKRDGLELVLKGGQVGGPDYFALAKAGGKR